MLKTLKTPSVSLPEPTHWLCTIYKHKRRKAKPYSLGSKKPRFRFSTVLTKNRCFRFRYGFRHSTSSDLRHFRPKTFQNYVFGAEVSRTELSALKYMRHFGPRIKICFECAKNVEPLYIHYSNGMKVLRKRLTKVESD